MDDPVGFGYWLRRRRKALDLTQTQFAQRVGCSLKTIQKLEAEERRPSLAMAERLADVLELAPAERRPFLKLARAERDTGDLVVPTQPQTLASPLAPGSNHTNLPRLRERLIGRERDVAAVVALLRRTDVGLVTLTGPGGIGKTRLSIQVGAEALDAFPDGVWFVALAPVGDPTLVATTIATALGVQPIGGEPLLDSLIAYLREKRLLLVLDNFEQVVAAAPLLAGLLHAASHLTMLVTSRTVLGVYGEHDIVVPPLALPDPTRLPPLEEVMDYAGVQLFCVRAQAADAAFALTPANAQAVVEICQRLDGLPLALELAARRVRLLPPRALLERLRSRLQLLTTGPRTLPARQQTLRDTIAWSYDLLDADDQRLFVWLGVFVGGWTLEAAEAVCGAGSDGALHVLDGLQSLVDKSLVQQMEGVGGAPRFSMLETIREYALEMLAASGETDALRERHATYYLAVAEAAEPALMSSDPGAWLERLQIDHDNLRAALAWSRTTPGGAERELRLVGALWRFWSMCSHISEGRRWLEDALERGPMAPGVLRVKALQGAGTLAWNQSDYAMTRLRLGESIPLLQQAADKPNLAETLGMLAMTALMQGDAAAAGSLSEASMALRQEVGDAMGLASAYLDLGFIRLQLGDDDQATLLLQEALRRFRPSGATDAIAMTLTNLGIVTLRQGDAPRATELLQEALTLFRPFGDETDCVAWVLRELGTVAHVEGDDTKARALLRQSLRLFHTLGQKRDVAQCLERLAAVDAAEGAPARAAQLLGAAARLRERIGAPLLPMDDTYYAPALATARAQLDQARWQEAWTDGGAMTLEQAVAYALDEAESS